MTASSLVKRTLFFLYLFLAKTYADMSGEKSAYSFTSGGSQYKVEFFEQRNEEGFTCKASTMIIESVYAGSVSNQVGAIFTTATEESEPDSPGVTITFSTPTTRSSDYSMSWILRYCPVLNRELIDDLCSSNTTGYEDSMRPSAPSVYTLPLGAFRVNNLIVLPVLRDTVVASRCGDRVYIRARISTDFISSYRSGSEDSHDGRRNRDRYTYAHGSVEVYIEIRLTGPYSVRVESIRTIGSESGNPDFNLSFLSEGQAEPPQPAPQLLPELPESSVNLLGGAPAAHKSF